MRRRVATDNGLLHTAVAMIAVAIAIALMGCTSGPSSIGNRFVGAVRDGKNVEASGYLTGELGSQNENAVSGLLASNAKADFVVDQQSDTTARIVSSSDRRDYMLLVKNGSNWQIRDVAYFTDSEAPETTEAEPRSQDDPSLWEGMSKTVSEARSGSAVYKTTVELHNGSSSQVGHALVRTIERAQGAVVASGTRPRSAGWITMRAASGAAVDVRVTDVWKYPRGGDYNLAYEIRNHSEAQRNTAPVANVAFEWAKAPLSKGYSRWQFRFDLGGDNRQDQPWSNGDPVAGKAIVTNWANWGPTKLSEVGAVITEGDPTNGGYGGSCPLSKLYPGPPSEHE